MTIFGAGPAGSSAALAALDGGSTVRILDPARFPRHKVCGEFLSPGAAAVLEKMGVWGEFTAARPAVIRRFHLRIGSVEASLTLPETAYGLSRYALDCLLLEAAIRRGATYVREKCGAVDGPTVVATGRRKTSPAKQKPDRRLFGFKAHFEGPTDDAVHLYCFDGCYAGVSRVEDGRTNVCGLAPVGVLRKAGFVFDELCASFAGLRERLEPLRRTMNWITTGPLVWEQKLRRAPEGIYPAGDAVSTVDPFTGSGLLSAMLSGSIAGRAASRQVSTAEYLSACSEALGPGFSAASLFRGLLATGLAEPLLRIVPAALLYRWTRPKPVSPRW